MLITTQAIVLKTVAHGDRATVLKAWTAHAGMRSYMVRLGSRKGGTAAALQPLNRLEIVADERTDHDLHTIREMRIVRPYMRLQTDPVRSAVALFAQEVLYRTLRAETPDPALDAFVHEALEAIDSAPDLRWFPHVFLLQLARHFGFFPEEPVEGCDFLDLQEGCFVTASTAHGHLLAPPHSLAFAALLRAEFANMHQAGIAHGLRRQLLDHVLLYFRLHMGGLGELRSPAVLQAVLS